MNSPKQKNSTIVNTNSSSNKTIVIKRPYELNQFFSYRNKRLLHSLQHRFYQGQDPPQRSPHFFLANRRLVSTASYGVPVPRFMNQRVRLRNLLFKTQPYRSLFTSLSTVKACLLSSYWGFFSYSLGMLNFVFVWKPSHDISRNEIYKMVPMGYIL